MFYITGVIIGGRLAETDNKRNFHSAKTSNPRPLLSFNVSSGFS